MKERADDPVLLSALGFVEQKHGHEKEARELYERALQLDPLANDAAANLGILEARSGNLRTGGGTVAGSVQRECRIEARLG